MDPDNTNAELAAIGEDSAEFVIQCPTHNPASVNHAREARKAQAEEKMLKAAELLNINDKIIVRWRGMLVSCSDYLASDRAACARHEIQSHFSGT